MSYFGEYQLGDLVPLAVQTVNASGTPTLPDAAPLADVFSASAKVATVKLPVIDLARRLFGLPLALSSAYAAGGYDVYFRWLLSGTPLGAPGRFEILAGGDAAGTIIGLATYRPNLERTTLLFQTDAGLLGAYREPRVE